MKKSAIIILSIITLILTIIFEEIFSIYHFGNVPTLLTAIYLIIIFSIFEYLLISITYVIRKLLKKERVQKTKNLALILLFIALLLIFWFVVVINVDWLNWYTHYSIPFYLNVIIKSFMYLFPSIILIAISILLIKNKNKK